ncbi:MAG: DUF1028 domain-containing protein [Desulfobacterales bacterium]|nr:DUF1028 domain-containing protein [Desulfobacterales bacterium]
MNFNRTKILNFLLFCLIFSFVLWFPNATHATWSITAVNPKTGEVGIAGASCTYSVWGIAGVAPGKGVIVAQAKSNMDAKRLGVKMLMGGASPKEVLKAITDPKFDPKFSVQQYGVAAFGFENESRSYTGADVSDAKAEAQGYGVSVQGNILPNTKVVIETLKAFESNLKNGQMSFADSLISALEAGAAAGGDRRCGKQKARSAFIIVANPCDDKSSPYLNLKIKTYFANPINLLRQMYDKWKKGRQ